MRPSTLFVLTVVAGLSTVTATCASPNSAFEGWDRRSVIAGSDVDGGDSHSQVDRSVEPRHRYNGHGVHRRSKRHRSHRKKRQNCFADDSGSGSDSPAPSVNTQPTNAVSVNNLQSLTAAGITGFLNQNGPGIGSWFRTNAGQDSTNGHSWCGYPYNDNSNGFAPDVSVMLKNFGGNYQAAATAYCGLEAIVTTPSGVSKTMYIVDGFDPRGVRTPGSIDITKNRFAELFGSATDNKNDVIKGITWKLTGNRSDQYKFKGVGN